MGHVSVAYIDDSYLKADTYDHCVENVIDTVTMFNNLGLVVRPEKSVLFPTQQLVFLGFILDSILMRISLTPEKARKVKNACQQLVDTVLPSITLVARVLGLLTSMQFPGVMQCTGPSITDGLKLQKPRPYTSARVTLIASCTYHQMQSVAFDGGLSQLTQHLTKSAMLFHTLP